MIADSDFNQRINYNNLFCFFVTIIITLRKGLTWDNSDEIWLFNHEFYVQELPNIKNASNVNA